jgi:hypothetical protein
MSSLLLMIMGGQRETRRLDTDTERICILNGWQLFYVISRNSMFKCKKNRVETEMHVSISAKMRKSCENGLFFVRL